MTLKLNSHVSPASIYDVYAGQRRQGYLRGVQPGSNLPIALLEPVALMQNLAAAELRTVVEGHIGSNHGYDLVLGTIKDAETHRLKLHAAAIKGATGIENVVRAHYSELKALSSFLSVLGQIRSDQLSHFQRSLLENSLKGFNLAITYANLMYDRAFGFICFAGNYSHKMV